MGRSHVLSTVTNPAIPHSIEVWLPAIFLNNHSRQELKSYHSLVRLLPVANPDPKYLCFTFWLSALLGPSIQNQETGTGNVLNKAFGKIVHWEEERRKGKSNIPLTPGPSILEEVLQEHRQDLIRMSKDFILPF